MPTELDAEIRVDPDEPFEVVSDPLSHSLKKLQIEILKLSNLRRIFAEYMAALSMGLDYNRIKTDRFIPVRVYLSKGDILEDQESFVDKELQRLKKMGFDTEKYPRHELRGQILGKLKIEALMKGLDHRYRHPVLLVLREFLETVEFKFYVDCEGMQGSLWKKFVAKSSKIMATEEFHEAISKAKRAIEAAVTSKTQAEVDKKQAEAASRLIEAIGDNEAILQIASILIVKLNKRIVAMTLSLEQLSYIENNRDIMRNPQEILDRLASLEKVDDIDKLKSKSA